MRAVNPGRAVTTATSVCKLVIYSRQETQYTGHRKAYDQPGIADMLTRGFTKKDHLVSAATMLPTGPPLVSYPALIMPARGEPVAFGDSGVPEVALRPCCDISCPLVLKIAHATETGGRAPFTGPRRPKLDMRKRGWEMSHSGMSAPKRIGFMITQVPMKTGCCSTISLLCQNTLQVYLPAVTVTGMFSSSLNTISSSSLSVAARNRHSKR
jgi:hypothetical protein